jgi:chromate transporter
VTDSSSSGESNANRLITPTAAPASHLGAVLEVFSAFLKLGVTSFGGPIAHLGYFERELIMRRQWLSPAHYAQLVALCQLLPGPASSQLGFSLGLLRAGWWGALAAFLAFTLPSVLLLVGFAVMLPLTETPLGEAVLHGLKLMAVAVVAQAVWSMAGRLTPDVPRRALALVAATVTLLWGANATVQLAVVGGGALLGFWACRAVEGSRGLTFDVPYGVRAGAVLLAAFGVLLAAALWVEMAGFSSGAVPAAFYRAGALVFGGGHVVLPLLEAAVVDPGWISSADFLAGYGAAQAVPGPMFSLAGFLGARLPMTAPLWGASISVLAIFLPGFLLVVGVLPLWQRLAGDPHAARILAGANAAVVGVLAAALYDPVCVGAIADPLDAVLALAALSLLIFTRISVLWVLVGCALVPVGRHWLG